MIKKYTISFLLLLVVLTASKASDISYTPHPQVNLNNLIKEKGESNLTLDEITTIIQDSIRVKGKVITPENTNAFEKALFLGRRIQHNDSQVAAVRIFKYLLEFEFYRTESERLYLKYLIGMSIRYLNSPLFAKDYIKGVFPIIFEEIRNPEVQGILMNQIGFLMLDIDSTEHAVDIFRDILRLYLNQQNIKKAIEARNNLGYSFQILNEYDSAKFYYKKNQNPKYKNINPVLYGYAYGNYGNVCYAEGNLDTALYYYYKEIKILNSTGSENLLYGTYAGMGQTYLQLNELDSSKHYFNKGLEYGLIQRDIEHITNSYIYLIKLLAKDLNSSELETLITNYTNLRDSVNRNIAVKTLRDELRALEFQSVFKETELSRKKFELLETKNTQLVYISIGLLAFTVALLLIILIRAVNRKKIKSQNEELEQKNKELNQSNISIREINKRNEILLKELHHRVKNNLQIISSLFSLQLNAKTLDVQTKEVFKEAKNRIQSISLVHKKLYQANSFEKLDFKEYLKAFSEDISSTNNSDISINIEMTSKLMSIDTAIPLGLIFNELITNSLKHSKTDNSLKVTIKFIESNSKSTFIYSDNGIGVQDIRMMTESTESIGVTLIHLLAEQLNSKIEFKEASDTNKGFWISLTGNFK